MSNHSNLNDDARSDWSSYRETAILNQLRGVGEVPHASLREAAVAEYAEANVADPEYRLDILRLAMVDQMWQMHAQSKIFRDVHKGTWVAL